MPVKVVGVLELDTAAWTQALANAQSSLNAFRSSINSAAANGSAGLAHLSQTAKSSAQNIAALKSSANQAAVGIRALTSSQVAQNAATASARSHLRQLSRDAQKASNDLENLKNKAHEAGKTLREDFARGMSLGVTLPVAAAAGQMIKFASNWQETENKLKVAFGNQAQKVKAWAEANSLSFGQASTDAKIAAADFALLLKNTNLSGEEIARMSTALVRLASDLSSLHDPLTPAEAMVKLRAGMVGEAEPLRRIGILVGERMIQLEAARLGLAKLGKELTESEKILARYSRIMIDSKPAHGDFARTQEQLKNSFQTLSSQLKNEATALGVQWLPFLTRFVKGLRELTTAFTNLPGPVKKALVALVGLAAAAGPLLHLKGVLDAISGWAALRKAIPAAAAKAAAAQAAAAAGGAAAAAGGAAAAAGAGSAAAGAAAGGGAAAAGGAAQAAIAKAGGISGILKTVAATVFSVAAIKVVAAAVVAAAVVGGLANLFHQVDKRFFWSEESKANERNLNAAKDASKSIARAQPGLMARRKAAGLAYYDSDGKLVSGSTQGLGSYEVPKFQSTRPAVDPKDAEKARKAAATAARKREQDIHEMMEARFSSRMDAGRVRAYGAPAGVQNQAEAASLIPIIREEQQRLLKLLQDQKRNTRAYWERVKIIWQLEEQAQDLAKDAATERAERIKTAWKKQEEQAKQIFEARMLQVEAVSGRAGEGERAQAELASALPVLRSEQGRNVVVAARVQRGSEEYWDAVKSFWNIEKQISQLSTAALEEQREATERQQRQRSAEKELLEERARMFRNIGQAAQEDRDLFAQQAELQAMRVGANPFLNPGQRQEASRQMFLARFRAAATPSIGETPEQQIERQQELERLRFAGYQSIGAGRWGMRGNRYVPLFNMRQAGAMARMFSGIESDAARNAMGGPNTGAALREYAWGSIGEGGPLPQMLADVLRQVGSGRGPNIFNLNINQEGSIFSDPRAQARLFQELRGALEMWSRQIAPGFAQ